MQTYSLAPVTSVGQKNYVFVDEHNRHKRLKVMRACEGCRRRKIKCDAATTNTWPCSACTRLKLQCVPPAIGNDREFSGAGQISDSDVPTDYNISNVHDIGSLHNQQSSYHFSGLPPSHTIDATGYSHPDGPYHLYSFPYRADSHPQIYHDMPQAPAVTVTPMTHRTQPFYEPPIHQMPLSNASTSESDQSNAEEDLSVALGELRIDETGIAPYLRNQKKHEPEPEGPLQDDEIRLPPLSTGAGSHIRIPPALMPCEEDAMHYFQVFFTDIHPYLPVINKKYFYQQWHSNRSSISPLLLETIFACAGRMSDDRDPAQGAQWLALANRHEENFLDTPRLSTLQALLLLLKARESVPKRGYYYKSWMTCKTIVSMAKDLDLHEHYATHMEGGSCGSNIVECLTKTRIWQTLLVLEMMVGAPQGRSDMGVDPESVDVRTDPPGSNMDDDERALSRQYGYFVRNARNIRMIADSYNKVKKKKDWGLDPELVANNASFNRWPEELPPDLQITFPPDGSPPRLPSHLVGNMHAQYLLGVVMLHRPQLAASKSFAADGTWKHHMTLCYRSAKNLCRIQEAILQKFGLTGLLCMLRGVSTAIYAILTCTMLHMVAITSPDPDFYTDARDFFTRHMRLLEQCILSWPMPEVEAQINSLRIAFSANINKPFELRASFPYGSPSEPYQPSPPLDPQYQHLQIPQSQSYDPHGQLSYASQTITPPISAGTGDLKAESPQLQQMLGPGPTGHTQVNTTIQHHPAVIMDGSQWNPTPIIDQWNTAFAIPQSALGPPSATSNNSPPTNLPVPVHNHHSAHAISPVRPHSYAHQLQAAAMASIDHSQPMPQTHPNYATHGPVFVSPKDWQQSVASVYDPAGLKRRWDYGATEGDMHAQKRLR